MEPSGLRKAEREIDHEAEALLKRGASAMEFSRQVFGSDGLLRRLWKTDEERKGVVASAMYRRLQQRLAELRERESADFDREVADDRHCPPTVTRLR